MGWLAFGMLLLLLYYCCCDVSVFILVSEGRRARSPYHTTPWGTRSEPHAASGTRPSRISYRKRGVWKSIISLKTTIPVILMFPLLKRRRATRPKTFIKSAPNGSNYSKELFSYPGGTFLLMRFTEAHVMMHICEILAY